MNGVLVIALIGALINYIINLIYFMLGRKRYRSYMEILKRDGNQKSSIFDFAFENVKDGAVFMVGFIVIYILIEELNY